MTKKARTLDPRDWYRLVGGLQDRIAALEFEATLSRCRDVYMRLLASGRDGRPGMLVHLRNFADAWDRTREGEATTPEATLRAAGISTKRQAKYQRRMSSPLAGRS